MVINYFSPDPFKATSISLNYDLQVTPEVVWRTEVKSLQADNPIFRDGTTFSTSNLTFLTSLAVKFGIR